MDHHNNVSSDQRRKVLQRVPVIDKIVCKNSRYCCREGENNDRKKAMRLPNKGETTGLIGMGRYQLKIELAHSPKELPPQK